MPLTHLNHNDILALEQRYRAQLINSLYSSKPAFLLASFSKLQNNASTNLAIFSQVFHLGANPALVGIVFRPDSVDRHSLSNIRENQFFSLQTFSKENYVKAHQTSARYPNNVSEFDTCGFEIEWIDNIPTVTNSSLRILCKLVQENRIELNGTILLIAQIESILVDDSMIQEDGFIDHELVNTVSVSGLDTYHITKRLGRLPYAKP